MGNNVSTVGIDDSSVIVAPATNVSGKEAIDNNDEITAMPETKEKEQPTSTANNNAGTSAQTFNQPSQRTYPADGTIQITDALSDVRVKYHVNAKELGHGHYGVVRKCMDRETKQWYAIKSIRKAKVKKIEVLKREIEILREVKHPNIIELVDVFEDAKYLHLVTELCTGGELFDRIIAKSSSPEGHYSEHDAASIIKSILEAISYCHSLGIVHRDLKPEVCKAIHESVFVRRVMVKGCLSQFFLVYETEFFVFDRR